MDMESIFQTEENWKQHISSLKAVKKIADKASMQSSLIEAIKKNIPEEKFGVLFSGGIDSTFISLVCKKFNKDFTCYCVGLENSEDIKEAIKVAKLLNLNLKTKILSLEDAGVIIKKVTKLLNEPDVMKVGVASVIYAGMELAQEDNVKYFFSGLGSEEIFAGYQRHEQAKDINEECWRGLYTIMYKRDIERDLKIASQFNAHFLLPFLDKEVIVNAMNLPADKKIKDGQNKVILREIAMDMGIRKEFAERKKRAAQYGSKIDRAILRLAKKNGFRYKKDYLRSLLS